MKPENLAGVQGSRGIPVLADLEKKLKLSLEAQTGGAVVLHCPGRIFFGLEVRALTAIISERYCPRRAGWWLTWEESRWWIAPAWANSCSCTCGRKRPDTD